MGLHAREGVGYLCMVDPLLQTLENHRLEAGRWVVVDVYEGEGVVHPEPFAAVALEPGRWWLPVGPDTVSR